MNKAEHYIENPELSTVHPDDNWKGVPVNRKGRFVNLHEPFTTGYLRLLKWQLSGNPDAKIKKEENRKIEVADAGHLFDETGDMIVWLGHASFLIRLSGVTFITDPVWFDSLFLKREIPLPFAPEKVKNIDYVLLSHDHRDHCDEATLRFIAERCPEVKVLTGLKMGNLIESWMPGVSITEAGWYQSYGDLKGGHEIIFTPSRHWGRRGLFDERKRLWGGFFIRTEVTSIYFMGDSGYGSHFNQIRRIIGEPDTAIMGVGAYKPEWFMHSAHINPRDAVRAFRELNGGRFIPMHYGTFDLSDEPLLDPLDRLRELELPYIETPMPGEIVLPEIEETLEKA